MMATWWVSAWVSIPAMTFSCSFVMMKTALAFRCMRGERGTPAGWADKTVMGLFGTGSYKVMSIWPPRLLQLCCRGQINVKTNPKEPGTSATLRATPQHSQFHHYCPHLRLPYESPSCAREQLGYFWGTSGMWRSTAPRNGPVTTKVGAGQRAKLT